VATAEAARAESLSAFGQPAEALSAITRARTSAATIGDAELRQSTQAAIDIAEGAVIREKNPAASMRLINSAVSFYMPRYRSVLPKAYLELGRTHSRAGEDDAALADFENGLREIDTQRSSITDKESRAAFYDTEPMLFSEAIELLLRHGDAVRAFDFSDRARARSVFEQESGPRVSRSGTGEDIQHTLPTDSALIEYVILRNSVAIFYFSSTANGVIQVPANSSAIAAMVDRCSDSLQHQRELRVVQQASAGLYRVLIDPLGTHLAGIRRLIVIPDRELHNVPFAALYDPRRNRYLLDDFTICIAANAKTILNRSTHGALAPVLVVGDPSDENLTGLRDAKNEAETIASMYPTSTLLSGERATRARFIAAAHRSGLIHYAGHANSDSFDVNGSLHLAGDSAGNSGDLDRNAVAALDLQNAPLVVLAACGTMRGNPEHMEGMPSIARAFLAAGARNVIGTLWDVDDEAVAPLFRRLHEELRSGVTPSDALRNAQLALVHSADAHNRHPSTWAPVELLGYTPERPVLATKRSD
jgi:CHAT domain-containing protein